MKPFLGSETMFISEPIVLEYLFNQFDNQLVIRVDFSRDSIR